MNSVSSATPTVAPPNPLDVVVDLITAVPLGSWPWVALAIASMALFAYAAYRTGAALTPANIEPLGARQAREAKEARR